MNTQQRFPNLWVTATLVCLHSRVLKWKGQVCKFDHLREHLEQLQSTYHSETVIWELLILTHSRKENMLHQRLHGNRAQEFHWTVRNTKDTVSQDTGRRINSLPLPKMERFYSVFQTCAAATYLCGLWLSQDPPMNQFNRIYTQPKKLLFSFGSEKRDEHSSQQEGRSTSK